MLSSISMRYATGMPWQRRQTQAVSDLTLAIAKGEIVGLVGESGSGKSTVGKICLGILQPTEGSAEIAGQPLYMIGRRRPGLLSAVLQHPEWSMNPRLTIGQSIAEPLTVLGEKEKAVRERVIAMLEQVGLPETSITRHPHELSGGQRQRASIARALITSPSFLVFDEAVSALDVSIQAQVLNLILDLRDKAGFSALFISHDLAAVRYLSDRIAVMRQGVMEALEPADAFYRPVGHPYVRQLQLASGLINDNA